MALSWSQVSHTWEGRGGLFPGITKDNVIQQAALFAVVVMEYWRWVIYKKYHLHGPYSSPSTGTCLASSEVFLASDDILEVM